LINIKEVGCLILHGFCGSQKEIKPLVDALTAKGYQVACPTLKGHTGAREDLIGVTYEEWLESARVAFRNIQASCGKVVIIGFSMGGLLAINLAREYKPAGLVTINTPIYIWALRQIVANIREDFRSKTFRHLEYYVNSARRAPFAAQWQFLLLLWKTKPLISKLNISKALILQVADDSTVKPKSADFIYKNLKSLDKNLKYYRQGGHLVLLSPVAPQVIDDVEKFLHII
jgi:carboxylesterase